MVDIKRRHHYLPRFYLKGFCDQNQKIWLYKKENASNPVDCSPSDTAVIRKLYSVENNPSGEDEIENYFAKEIETSASVAFKQLLDKKFPDNVYRERLALFFGTLMVRTPSYIEFLNTQQSQQISSLITTIASNKNIFRLSYRKVHKNKSEAEIEVDRLAILDGTFSFKLHRNLLLSIMINFGSVIASHLLEMRWALIETDDDYPFITSDNMMNISHPTISHTRFYQPGLATPNIRVNIPISKNLSLLLINNNNILDGTIFSLTNMCQPVTGEKINLKNLIKALNKTTFIKANKYIFANSNSNKLKKCFNNLLLHVKHIEDH